MYNLFFYLYISGILALPIFFRENSVLFFFLLSISFISALFFLFRLSRFKSFLNENALKIDNISESINLLEPELRDKISYKERIPSNINIINDLEKLLEKLNPLRNVDNLPVYVLDYLRELFPASSNILFFRVDENSGLLSLAECNRKDRGSVFSEQHGDTFGHWVIKNTKSLMVDDVDRDFRLSSRDISCLKQRRIRSFISSPIVFGNKVLGAIRIESHRKNFLIFQI